MGEEESSADRRKRLAALRAEASAAGAVPITGTGGGGGDDDEETEAAAEVKITFRNYQPRAKDLAELHVGGMAVPDVEEATAEIREIASKPQEDVLNIAPKKPNWDLKRNVERDLAVLTKRTTIAIAKIAKELADELESESDDDNSADDRD